MTPIMWSVTVSKLERAKLDELLMEPFEYVNKEPSKYHKIIGLTFNHWLKISEDKMKEMGEIIQILHTTTLLIDDIQDDSKLRYGKPAAHLAFGVGLTINAACNIYFVVLKKILELCQPMAVDLYCENLLDTHRGQGIEIYWRDNFHCPTEEEYIDMLKLKASAFFVFVVQLFQLFSDNKENYVPIAELIGVYYAIRDDYSNLFNLGAIKSLAQNAVRQENITPDCDITEGKFTLPIIHAINTSNRGEEIINILKMRTSDPKVLSDCISLLKELGSAKYTGDILRRMESDIHEQISRLGGNPPLTQLINELGDWKQNEAE